MITRASPSRIYHTQDEGYAFSNVNDLLGAMDPTFALMLERSLEDGLKEAGISDRFIEELATAVMRVNYGQLPNAHQFVGKPSRFLSSYTKLSLNHVLDSLGSVSLAGAESGLWSVSGGNKQIPQALLNASGANLLNEEVDSIHLSPDGRLSLWFKNNDEESPLYDAVILATPLSRDTTTIKFENFPRRFNFPGRYHRTVATMVQGEINYKTFGFHDKKSVVDDIFTTNGSLFFNSVARNYPVDADDGIEGVPPVWKVFSNERLTRSQLELLFSEINETQVIEWKAYPEYDGSESPGNFTLHPGLYHINAIEFAASAIEMGIIGARNVALLTASHFGIDIQEERTQNFHVELWSSGTDFVPHISCLFAQPDEQLRHLSAKQINKWCHILYFSNWTKHL